jgi:hypothetical protein
MTQKEAEKAIREAMLEHGSPNWVAYVPRSVRAAVPVDRIAELREELARSRRRGDPLSDLVGWAAANHGLVATTAQIAEAVGVSTSTVLNAVDKRPDTFIKRGRGKYELRDSNKDRAEARTNKEETEMEKKA